MQLGRDAVLAQPGIRDMLVRDFAEALREGFDVLGTEWRCTMHFGAWAIDWRGALKSAGA